MSLIKHNRTTSSYTYKKYFKKYEKKHLKTRNTTAERTSVCLSVHHCVTLIVHLYLQHNIYI